MPTFFIIKQCTSYLMLLINPSQKDERSSPQGCSRLVFCQKALHAFIMLSSPWCTCESFRERMISVKTKFSPLEKHFTCSRRLYKNSYCGEPLASCLNNKETFSDNFNKVLSVIIDPRLTSRRRLGCSQLRSKVLFKRYRKALCAQLAHVRKLAERNVGMKDLVSRKLKYSHYWFNMKP